MRNKILTETVNFYIPFKRQLLNANLVCCVSSQTIGRDGQVNHTGWALPAWLRSSVQVGGLL